MARILLAHREVLALSPATLYRICVIHGHLWLSHEGDDILLHAGDSWAVPAHSQERIVIEALRNNAQCVLMGHPPSDTELTAKKLRLLTK